MTPKNIVIYTRSRCEDSDAARQFLKRRHRAFHEVTIDESPEALRFVVSVNDGKKRTPAFEVDCDVFHCSPFDPEKLAHRLGLPQEEAVEKSELQSAVARACSSAMPSSEGTGGPRGGALRQ